MRPGKFISALVLAFMGSFLVSGGNANALQSSSSSGDKTAPSQASSAPSSNPKPSPDDNAFPEDASRAAATQANQQKQAEPQPQQANPDAQKPATDDNAFPEETSRKAADAAKSTTSSSGVSSSSDYEDHANAGRSPVEPNVNMRHLHTRDLTREDIQVGSFYLQSGDYKGAYVRYKEASQLHPENTDAMFGLAEAARHLNKNDEALENYRLYLDVIPSGSKAKDARKALAQLAKSKQ